MYESYYLRAVSPREPTGIWIRYTVHKRQRSASKGSLWLTVFDAARGAPVMEKTTLPAPSSPAGAWIAIGDAVLGPGEASGSIGGAHWSLRFEALGQPLRHLRPGWLYRAPLPRTKLTSPAPLARFAGVLELPGRPPLELDGWPGMVGHNWGSEHAERWIWLHGCAFEGRPAAWLDLAAGRVAIGTRSTPWVLSGALELDGVRSRVGGLLARPRIRESSAGCELRLGGRGASLALTAAVPSGSAAGWRYADPDGGEHDVVNCSVAALRVSVSSDDGDVVHLSSAHGGAYELGMRERDHGIPLAPFGDG
jgi:hypothetical protein